MDDFWKTAVWSQFGAAIDMLENAARACPDDLWGDRSRELEFWYVLFHTLFYLDLYLSESVARFTPPAPFTLDELDDRGLKPERVYTKVELMNYLRHGREKCRTTIESLTESRIRERSGFSWLPVPVGEVLLYNLRHVQHHAAQLNLMLRQGRAEVPPWVRTSGVCL